MNKPFLKTTIGAGILSLCACSSAATLSPMGDARDWAKPALHARFDDLWCPTVNGGAVKIMMPDGEELNGRYSFLRRGETGYGSLYNVGHIPTGAYDPRIQFVPEGDSYIGSGAFGKASASGAKGTTMRCEFFYDARNGEQGWGTCKDSRQALYSLKIYPP